MGGLSLTHLTLLEPRKQTIGLKDIDQHTQDDKTHGRRFLTVCQGGLVRSTGMKFALTYKYKLGEAIAVGVEGNSQFLIKQLAGLVDLVIVMQKGLEKLLPEGVDYVICDVGPDVYGDPFHEKLQEKISNWVVANAGLVNGTKVLV